MEAEPLLASRDDKHDSLIQLLESIRDGGGIPAGGHGVGPQVHGKSPSPLKPASLEAAERAGAIATLIPLQIPASSPTFSNDSLVSPGRPEGAAARKKDTEAENAESKENMCTSQYCDSDAASLSKENVRPDNGRGNFQASLRDLSELERQLDAALVNQPGLFAFLGDEEKSRKTQDSTAEVRELKARLRKAENDLRCSEELRQADEVEKDMLSCERSTLEAQIHTLRSERDSLAAENESLARREKEREIRDQDGEQDLQRAVEALRSSKQNLEQARAREAEIAQELAETREQLASCQVQLSQLQSEHTEELDALKNELSKCSAAAVATASKSVAAMFSKSTRQQAAILQGQTLRSWHSLAQTLGSRRAAIAARAVNGSAGLTAADARMIIKGWQQHAQMRLMIYGRVHDVASQKDSELLRGTVRIWVAWARRKVLCRRQYQKIAAANHNLQLKHLWKQWSMQHKTLVRVRQLVLRWRGPDAVYQRVLKLWQRFVQHEHAKQEQLLQKQAAEAELEAAKRRLTEAETNAAAEIAAAEETTKAKLEEAAQALERQLQDSHEQTEKRLREAQEQIAKSEERERNNAREAEERERNKMQEAEERGATRVREEFAQEKKRIQERSKVVSDRLSLLENQLQETLAKMDEKDSLIEALCTDLKLVQAARQAEQARVQKHIQELDADRERELSRVRQEELEACQEMACLEFKEAEQKYAQELEAVQQKLATVMEECENEVRAVKQKANSTAEELRAQVRALMEQEEERGMAETQRICQRISQLEDLLEQTQYELAQTQDEVLRANERAMSEFVASSLVLSGPHHPPSVAHEDSNVSSAPVASPGRDNGLDLQRKHLALSDLTKLANSIGGGTEQDAIAAQVGAARFREERDEMQSKVDLLTITNNEMTHRIQSLTRELELLATENNRLREDIQTVEAEHARQLDVIKQQNSHDMHLLLEANEAATREKDWFGSLYNKSRDAERLLFKEKEALTLELVDIKQQHDQLLHLEVQSAEELADLREDNESLSVELDAIRAELGRLHGHPSGSNDGAGETRGKGSTNEERENAMLFENGGKTNGCGSGDGSGSNAAEHTSRYEMLKARELEMARDRDRQTDRQRLGWTLAQLAGDLKSIQLDCVVAYGEMTEVIEENVDLRDDKESLEIEIDGIRHDLERQEQESSELRSENETMQNELSVLKSETEQLISLLGNII